MTAVASFYYQLDAAGNRINLADNVNGTSRTFSWNYDNLYRLTNETVSGASPTGNLGYGYDDVGNRTIRSGSLGSLSTQNFTYSSNDWLSTDIYDSNGNTRTNASNQPYLYDYANRLTNFNNGQVIIFYNADGNRVKKVAGGVTTLYLVATVNPSGYPQVVEELTVSGGVTNLSRTYTWGLSLINQRIPGTTTNFYGFDGHGSTRFLTSPNGAVTDTYTYDAYGNLINSTGSTPNSYLYCCYQYDADLELYYNIARYWKTDTGRFWTLDSFEGNNEDPLSLHKYLYCHDNPVNLHDPSGHDGDLMSLEMSAEIGAGLDAEEDVATTAASKAARKGLFQVYLGIHISMPPHAAVFVNNIITDIGTLYDAYPINPVPTDFGTYSGHIRQQAVSLANFERPTYFPINFKVCKFNELQYIGWRTTMQVLDSIDDDESTWTQIPFSL
jgi:RHS repeat-associated protein